MKLAKALKQKNKLAGEVAQLKELLAEQNSRSTKQKFDYNNQEVLTNLRAKIDELVATKAAIGAANAEVYPKIFRLAELKGFVTALKGLSTKEGVYAESLGYSQSVEVEYVAQIKKAEVDKLVEEIEKEIQELQDALDEFNFTRSVNA
ncbi:MAG: hypothetical protein WCH43_07350 [Verrucomicrobiota bacterium]